MKNILITGGCGFIGRAFLANQLSSDVKVRVFDNLSFGTREDLAAVAPNFTEMSSEDDHTQWNDKVSLVVGDILDENLLKKAFSGADICLHLAANTGVGPSVENPRSDCNANVIGTLNTLEACRLNSVKRFVFASSGAPLGVQSPPLNENMAPRPASPYGASKLAGEAYCSAYYHCFGVETVALRFGNVYGPGSTKKSSVVAKFIREAYAGETLEIYGDGSQTRDFIYIDDLIEAINAAMTKEGVGGEAFQIASASETTIGEITEVLVGLLEKKLDRKVAFKNGETRVGDVQRNFSDTSKAKQMLGWTATVALEEGLDRTVESFHQHAELLSDQQG